MLRLIGISIALLTGLNVFAQGEMKLGFQSGVNFSYRFLNNNNNEDRLTEDVIRHLDTYESPGVGYRFAFVGDYQISKHFNLEVGAAITRNQYVYFISNSDVFFNPIDGELVTLPENVESLERSTNYLYAGIPVRGIYRAGLSSLKFLGHIGLSPQILVDNTFKNEVKYTNGTIENTETEAEQDLANFNFFPFFGVGLEWELKGKWCLRTEAVARYGALDISNESPINTRLVSSEFTAGIYYSIRSGKDSTE